MGFNAVVHRVQLRPTSADGISVDDANVELLSQEGWDAAVKRPFGLSKMLAFLESSSEAGLAKRMRFANSLNSDGRVLYFYGLGVALSANAYNQHEFKFEAVLLAKYEEEFSTYTMRRFMEDYIALPEQVPEERREEILALQAKFSIILVKTFLVSLLNSFRDLTLVRQRQRIRCRVLHKNCMNIFLSGHSLMISSYSPPFTLHASSSSIDGRHWV